MNSAMLINPNFISNQKFIFELIYIYIILFHLKATLLYNSNFTLICFYIYLFTLHNIQVQSVLEEGKYQFI